VEKTIIKNRKGLKMAVIIDEVKNQKGLVFVMHGFGSFKEHKLLTRVAKIFNEKDFTAIRFDTTNSIGESEGKLEDATMTEYFEDLEDIIEWSKSQKWYQEPFSLVGHSLGGYCIANYAIKNQDRVNSLILFGSIISGKLFQETDKIKPLLKDWKEKGIREWESSSSPGVFKKSKYAFIEDGMNHDLLKNADKIKCPVVMITGENDESIPVEHQKMLFDKIKSSKQFYVLKTGNHNLKGMEDSPELFSIISKNIT
jgi:alpha-beta hydrolase superfamily lysophospholipase